MPRSPQVLLVLLLCLLVWGGGLPTANGQTPDLSEQSEVSLITILPGTPLHTIFGHSAIRVHDPARDVDRLYNYGTFNFDDPLFIPKFTYGYLRYFLSVASYPGSIRVYRQQGRSVIEQTLNLTQSQRNELFHFLQVNARPENRYYQYEFFFDNCSTRVRDALKAALGDEVAFSNQPDPKESYRQLLDRYTGNRPLLDLGFDVGLGLPADRSPSAWEAMFLPEYLMKAFDHATVSANGQTRPLVARTDTVQWISDFSTSHSPVEWPVTASWGLFVLVLGWTGWQAASSHRPSGRGDAILLAVTGLVGLVICFLWFISTYTVTEYNLNLAWAWPTHLVAAAVLLRHPASEGLRLYMGTTALAAVFFSLAWPLWPQNLHAAVLPFVLTLGVRTGWLTFLYRDKIGPLSEHLASTRSKPSAPAT